jgi:hypothetical protein
MLVAVVSPKLGNDLIHHARARASVVKADLALQVSMKRLGHEYGSIMEGAPMFPTHSYRRLNSNLDLENRLVP